MRGTVEGWKERFLRLQKECVERRRKERKKERGATGRGRRERSRFDISNGVDVVRRGSD